MIGSAGAGGFVSAVGGRGFVRRWAAVRSGGPGIRIDAGRTPTAIKPPFGQLSGPSGALIALLPSELPFADRCPPSGAKLAVWDHDGES